MRSEQLSIHIRNYFSDRYDVERIFTSRGSRKVQQAWLKLRYPGAIYVFSKNASWVWQADDFENLGSKAGAILVDYVDGSIREMAHSGVDVHLSTSWKGARIMQEYMEKAQDNGTPIKGNVKVVLHNYDRGISERCAPKDAPSLSMAYLGNRELAAASVLADRMVTFLDASSAAAFRQSVGRLSQFNAHFCVRNALRHDPRFVAKPFTKGATAAACGAVILTDHDTDDAVEQLGADYPFLAASNASEHVDEMLLKMADEYGSAQWRTALDRVEALHAMTTHRAIADQLDQAIRSVS